MKSLFKLILGLSGLLVVVLIAAVIAVATLDPNDHKDWISEQALERTGRTLALDGDINVTFYPWLGLEANRITLGNAAGFGDTPFLHADYLKLRIKLMPILKDHYEIDTVIIRGAVINLARNKDGVSNWDDLVAAEKKEDQAAFPLAAVVLGGVDIQQASLHWRDASTDTDYQISNLDIRTDALRYGEPLKLGLTMDLKANKPALDGHVSLKGTLAYDIDNQLYNIKPLELVASLKGKNIPGGETRATLSAAIALNLDDDTVRISDLKLDALGTQVSGSLNASRIQTPAPSVQANIQVKGRDLAQLFKIVEIEPLASQIARLENRSFTLKTSLDADLERGDIDVPELSLAILGAAVQGHIKARNMLSETPGYKGQLHAAAPDLPTLLQVLGQFQGGSESALTEYGLKLAKIKRKAFKIDADFDVDLEQGDIDVPELSLAILGATVRGHVRVRDMLSETPGYRGQLKAAGPDLPALLRVLGQFQGGGESALTEYGHKFAKIKRRAFKIDAGFDADLKSGNIDIPTLDIDALGVKVSGHLKARDMQAANGVVNGTLKVSGNKLSQLLVALDQEALSEVLQTLNFKAGIAGNASNLSLKPMSLQATLAGGRVGKKPVNVSLNADTHINLDKDTLSMAGLTLRGLGLNVTGGIEASNFRKAPEFNGQINVAPFNLRSLMSKLNQELPVTADKKAFTKVGISTQFAGSTSKLKVKQLALVLDETHLKGDFSIVDFANPVIKFGIDIDQINADRYLPPPVKGKDRQAVTPETAAAAVTQLPVETLQALNVDGQLSIGKLIISNAKMTNVRLGLKGKEGQVRLDPVAANLYGGTYSGKISINANGKLPKLVVNSAIKGVQIEPLLRDTTGTADLVGKGDISIAVVARGNNTDTLKKTLSGQAEIHVTNGIVRGVDVPKALEQVEIMIESKRFGKVDTTGDTPFDSLTATLPINAGVVSNEDLLLSAPGFTVRGKGMLARLSDMRWKYDLKVSVDERSVARGEKTYNIGDYSIPIKCRGKIAGENCKPDKMSLAGNAVKKIILDKIKLPGSSKSTGTNATDKNIDPGKELLDKALKSIFK